MLGLLVLLNLRGIKERSRCCCRSFLGFVAAHVVLIVYGIYAHLERCRSCCVHARRNAKHGREQRLDVRRRDADVCLSHGGGTYTGWRPCRQRQHLAEPRVRTGKWTMLYMAVSFAFTAADTDAVRPVGRDAAARAHAQRRRLRAHHRRLGLGSAFATTPACSSSSHSKQACCSSPRTPAFWAVPRCSPTWRSIPGSRGSSGAFDRLVTQKRRAPHGWLPPRRPAVEPGQRRAVVVLYSINVFLTFAIALYGLCVYWWDHRRTARNWKNASCFLAVGLSCAPASCSSWCSASSTKAAGSRSSFRRRDCSLRGDTLALRRDARAAAQDRHVVLQPRTAEEVANPPAIDPHQPTAVFFVGKTGVWACMRCCGCSGSFRITSRTASS